MTVSKNKRKSLGNVQKTPKSSKITTKKTPNSAPQIKRKKLEQEIDDELSDIEFEKVTASLEKESLKQKGKKNAKTANNTSIANAKTPVKSNKNTPVKSSKNTPVKSNKNTPVKSNKNSPVKCNKNTPAKNQNAVKTPNKTPKSSEAATVTSDAENRNDRTLYISHIPRVYTEQELKSLSSDAVDARILYTFTRNTKKARSGFLEFSTAAKAKKNLSKLNGITVKGRPITAAMAGKAPTKSKSEQNKTGTIREADPKKIHITGYNIETFNLEVLQALFPNAQRYQLDTGIMGKPMRFCFVTFATEKQCQAALEQKGQLKHDGRKLLLQPAHKRSKSKKRAKKTKQKKNTQEVQKQLQGEENDDEEDFSFDEFDGEEDDDDEDDDEDNEEDDDDDDEDDDDDDDEDDEEDDDDDDDEDNEEDDDDGEDDDDDDDDGDADDDDEDDDDDLDDDDDDLDDDDDDLDDDDDD